jgi:hypothetical protein
MMLLENSGNITYQRTTPEILKRIMSIGHHRLKGAFEDNFLFFYIILFFQRPYTWSRVYASTKMQIGEDILYGVQEQVHAGNNLTAKFFGGQTTVSKQ